MSLRSMIVNSELTLEVLLLVSVFIFRPLSDRSSLLSLFSVDFASTTRTVLLNKFINLIVYQLFSIVKVY